MPHVIIIGGGFGGLYATKELKNSPFKITLIDKRNFHLFQPLLYQVATGGLSPGDIAYPLRAVFHRYKNIHVAMAEVVDIDPQGRKVILTDGEIDYDHLIIAPGSGHYYFGNSEWADIAPGLKTIEDAISIRHRILKAYEMAERETDPQKQAGLLTFVIVGGGPTGVEIAGAVAELARGTMKNDFRRIYPPDSEIILVESGPRILATFPLKLSAIAEKSLKRLGVRVLTHSRVTAIAPGAVTLATENQSTVIHTGTILWSAGVKASPLGEVIAARFALNIDRQGRVPVKPDLSLPGYPEVFVIGDLADFSHQDGKPLPGVATVAMQEGGYVARLLKKRLRGKQVAPFHYVDKGNLAVIGRNAAVADIKSFRFGGVPAWLVWVFVHIRFMIGFDHKIVVLIQWAWNYFTRNRGARLITGEAEKPRC
ncbi:MAG TPA: NAD(P)/FAD-dependent oxidoreductase [Candidatus Deferrimicrobium sp.]|nr:NAD(P)/FAD-dependent oxidoreductase [Candidatus Deferrimicrobium sp.]